ncbi:hypothetical protein ACIBCR_04690 [Micromonospora echinospora]
MSPVVSGTANARGGGSGTGVVNTDAHHYSGSDLGNLATVRAESAPRHTR